MIEPSLLYALRTRRPEIRARWEALLRIERINTPLANPDTLVHLFDWTLDEVYGAISMDGPVSLGPPVNGSLSTPRCACGRNPYVAYFKAAKQALMEALVLSQSGMSLLNPIERDSAADEMRAAIDALANREIASFCALCTHRGESIQAKATVRS